MNSSELVRIEGLVVRRGSFTLNVPRWTVEPGNVIGLVGPNGAGKTTLIETLAGLRSVHGGDVRVFDLLPRQAG